MKLNLLFCLDKKLYHKVFPKHFKNIENVFKKFTINESF